MKKIEVENLNEEESLSEDILKISEMYWKDYLESLNLNTDIEKMCEICIQEQITQHGAQVIKCKGRLNAKTQLGEELYEELKSVMTPSEFDNLEAAYSPYEFMNRKCDVKNIGKDNRLFKHRWYQQQALECVHEDTLIAMGDGTTKKIKDIVVGDKVLSYNETRRTVPTNKVLNKWNKGVRPVYRITLENADYIEVTDNHPILAHFKDGLTNTKYDCKSFKLAYKSIKEGLDVGMDVYTLNQNVKWGAYDNLEVAKLLGYLVTDGYINLKKSKIQFANIRKEYVDEVVSIVKNTFDCSVNYKEIEAYTDKNNISRKHTYDAHVTNASKLKDFLKSINCIDKSTKEESILTFALNNFSESAMRVFINRAYAGDGCVYNYESGTSTISFAGRISDFIPKWRELLRKIGIWSPRVYTKTKLNNSGMTCCFSRTDDIIRFFNFVGEIYGKEKQSKLSLENALKRTHNIKKRGRFKTTTRTKIKSIEYIGEKPVYDIEVENRHNFIANNIIVHNCSSKTKVVRMGRRCGKTFALASTIVATALTDLGSKGTGHRILLVSPFQNQTEEVIETIKIICRSFDVDPIESSKASPVHIIKFKNGSIIKGFTAGIDGNSIRGQPADSMYLDEYDDMPVKAITSISAVVMDNPDVKIWLSGTPKGELNLFKEAQNLNSKEFYYPSYVIPHYSDDMDFEMRSKLDEIGYLQEVMALYGVTSDNIYQILFIKRATEKQYYLSPMDYFSNRANYISILGVDWNHDQVGTRLVLVAYDKTLQQFYILDKARVSLEGWTQQKAMEKIIEFNRRYNIDHIFVDAGFGATQIGDLRLYGELQIGKVPKGHPDLKLMDVQPVDFGSNVEIRDPHSGETFKQGLKQFAVQNSVLILEKDMITLHPEEDKDIIAQMKNYIQKSRNKGRVTYGYISKKVGDHDLDALIISLFGFKKLYSSTLGDNIHQVMMRFSSPKNEDGSEIVKEEIDYSAHRVQLRFGSKKGLAKYSQRVVKLNRESRRRSY